LNPYRHRRYGYDSLANPSRPVDPGDTDAPDMDDADDTPPPMLVTRVPTPVPVPVPPADGPVIPPTDDEP
jgi:hypothetical protein